VKLTTHHLVPRLMSRAVPPLPQYTGYGLDDWIIGVRFPVGVGNFPLYHRVQNGLGAYPASYTMGTRVLSLGVRRPGRETDHSPSSAEVKNA
jgi:hypothetical protein